MPTNPPFETERPKVLVQPDKTRRSLMRVQANNSVRHMPLDPDNFPTLVPVSKRFPKIRVTVPERIVRENPPAFCPA